MKRRLHRENNMKQINNLREKLWQKANSKVGVDGGTAQAEKSTIKGSHPTK